MVFFTCVYFFGRRQQTPRFYLFIIVILFALGTLGLALDSIAMTLALNAGIKPVSVFTANLLVYAKAYLKLWIEKLMCAHHQRLMDVIILTLSRGVWI